MSRFNGRHGLDIKSFISRDFKGISALRINWQSQPWDITEQMQEITAWKKLKEIERNKENHEIIICLECRYQAVACLFCS